MIYRSKDMRIPDTTAQYYSVYNLLNLLRKLTVHSAKTMQRFYEKEFDEDFGLTECCEKTKDNCDCYIDDYYRDDYDYPEPDTTEDDTNQTPAK